jgi:hypothetical protein
MASAKKTHEISLRDYPENLTAILPATRHPALQLVRFTAAGAGETA